MSYQLLVSVPEGIIKDNEIENFILEFSDFQHKRNHPQVEVNVNASQKNKGKVISLAVVDDKNLNLNLIDMLDFLSTTREVYE